MRDRLVIGNWKLNGSVKESHDLVQSLLEGVKKDKVFDLAQAATQTQIVICPPLVYLAPIAEQLKGSVVQLGAQNIFEHEKGAYTGEVSASMLKDFSVSMVLVGHSERRTLMGDTNERVAAKFKAVIEQEMVPVLCLGETLEQRESNQTEDVLCQQLQAILNRVSAVEMAKSVIAYEPIWAIGTGRTASAEQAQQIHQFIRNWLLQRAGEVALTTQILYGGSVNAENAEQLFSQPDIDGGLIGGASLNASSFLAICNS